MKINKPKFWDQVNLIAILLTPLSLIVQLVVYLKKKFTKEYNFKIPVICVGNIFIGGTGKTPLSLFIAKIFTEKNLKSVIIRKFYEDHQDEYSFIKFYFKDLIISENRKIAIKEAQDKNYDIAILDDGFQDYTIAKNFNIICFNQRQMIGNGMVIPSGPLREKINSLKRAQLVMINGRKDAIFEKKIFEVNKDAEIFYSNYHPTNLNDFKNKKLLAISGIGNPSNFFNLLSSYGLIVSKKFSFPDHYDFSKVELENFVKLAQKNNYQIIMTEKDYFRIQKYNFEEIKYLKLDLKIDNLKIFKERIFKIYD